MSIISQDLIKQAIAEGIITFEQYLQIPWDEHESMECLFSPDGRQAVKDGVITLKQYLKIPSRERESMKYIFSCDGRQALAEGIITLEQYLKIPSRERESMICLFSPNGRQAVKDGVITIEQYLDIPWDQLHSMENLFLPNGGEVVADRIITLERYLQIPSRERQNVMTALRDPDMRRRIRNGEITIENVMGVRHYAYVVAVPNINDAQSTHNPSVHQTVSESATRLAKLYKSRIDGAGLESTIKKVKFYIHRLPDDSLKNQAAKRGFLRIVAPNYTFTDSRSQVTIRQLLALVFLAIHDDEKRAGSLEDAKMQFVEGLYEIQREYNISESGVDQGGGDICTCPPGTFNKLIEKLQGIHPDCVVLHITEGTASTKLPAVVREEAMQYLETFAKPNTAEALLTFTRLMAQVKKDGVEVIWEHIKEPIATRMWDEFGSLYRNRTDPRFTELVEAGKDGEFDLSTLQEQVERDYLSEHRSDGLEIYCQINLQLDELKNKAENLRDRNYTQDSEQATTIVNALRNLNRDYFIEKKIDYKIYKEKSLAIINQERSELDKHRGYKQILGNLLILILTLGTAQLINKACNDKFLFFNSTDSSKKLDNLNKIIEKAAVNKNHQTNSFKLNN